MKKTSWIDVLLGFCIATALWCGAEVWYEWRWGPNSKIHKAKMEELNRLNPEFKD